MAEPLKLEASEVEFWKSVYLMHLDFLQKRYQSFWSAFSFSTPPMPDAVADSAVRSLRERRRASDGEE
jgi:hypothetical protein